MSNLYLRVVNFVVVVVVIVVVVIVVFVVVVVYVVVVFTQLNAQPTKLLQDNQYNLG